MKNFFRSMSTFIRAIPHFILFELVYKLILLAVGAPLMTMLLNLTMKAAGISYLDDESLLVYLHSPATIAVIFIILFLAGFFAFVELSALAACFSCFQKHERITVGEMLFTGLRSFRKAFRRSRILRFALFMLCMPLAEFTLSSGIFLSPLMPLLNRVFASVSSYLAIVAYIFIEALFILIIVSRCYSLHYLILTGKSFPRCRFPPVGALYPHRDLPPDLRAELRGDIRHKGLLKGSFRLPEVHNRPEIYHERFYRCFSVFCSSSHDVLAHRQVFRRLSRGGDHSPRQKPQKNGEVPPCRSYHHCNHRLCYGEHSVFPCGIQG